jgi:hypothetical protein
MRQPRPMWLAREEQLEKGARLGERADKSSGPKICWSGIDRLGEMEEGARKDEKSGTSLI